MSEDINEVKRLIEKVFDKVDSTDKHMTKLATRVTIIETLRVSDKAKWSLMGKVSWLSLVTTLGLVIHWVKYNLIGK